MSSMAKIHNAKVLVATPNYQNVLSAEAHVNHMECIGEWTKMGIKFNWTLVGRTFVHFARTQLCETALEGRFTHILWVDDDALIQPEWLPKWIEADKDIILAPYPMRRPPHEIGALVSTTGDFHNHASYRNWTPDDLNQGIVEIDGGGTHCMLVKVDVFHKAGLGNADPIAVSEEVRRVAGELGRILDSLTDDDRRVIEHHIGEIPDERYSLAQEHGQGKPYFLMPKTGTEDMLFCYRAKKKGLKVWCDSDVFSDHVAFAPVIRLAHTDFFHREKQQHGQSVSVPDVQQGAAPGDAKPVGVSGVRGKVVDTRKSAQLV